MHSLRSIGLPLLLLGSVTAATKLENLNQWLVDAEYAVRGAILDRSFELQKILDERPGELPFKKITACNIGNPQALGQKPLSYNRQVLSLVTNPSMLEDDTMRAAFPVDVVARAENYISRIKGGVGAYSNSQGVDVVREEVAAFISERDGVPADPENIFLTDGASAGVRMVYTTMVDSSSGNDGLLVPIPQYPLYSALTTLHNAHLVPYYLDEGRGWTLTATELRRALADAKAKGITVKALAVINPGNPTGQCMSEESMREIIQICAAENLVLLADEVYQENVYTQARGFMSFKKVASNMLQSPDTAKSVAALEMISFHSVSKGFIGECGIRGGYFELFNIADEVKAQLYKLASLTLCSNTHGQLSVGLMVRPPTDADASFATYTAEKQSIFNSLKRRATKLEAALNKLVGVSTQPLEGAMYAFPQIELPSGVIKAASAAKMQPDAFFALKLLEGTVCSIEGFPSAHRMFASGVLLLLPVVVSQFVSCIIRALL
jgi:alanine transaminase